MLGYNFDTDVWTTFRARYVLDATETGDVLPLAGAEYVTGQVLVADGGTVVIGGIIVTQQQTQVNQVPIVGSLPIVGYLFRRTSVTIQSQELLFFLTPRIIPG